jgi:uncharacterized membrane protein
VHCGAQLVGHTVKHAPQYRAAAPRVKPRVGDACRLGMALRLLLVHSMRAQRYPKDDSLHPISTLFPSVLLALAPVFDIVRMVTRNPAWARAAFWSALAGVVVVAVAVLPQLVDWLAADRHTRARTAGIAPLTLHLAAIAPLGLGVFERLHLAAAARAASVAALPSVTRLEAWPMALAIAGALSWLLGQWMESERIEERVRYQPTGLPSRA